MQHPPSRAHSRRRRRSRELLWRLQSQRTRDPSDRRLQRQHPPGHESLAKGHEMIPRSQPIEPSNDLLLTTGRVCEEVKSHDRESLEQKVRKASLYEFWNCSCCGAQFQFGRTRALCESCGHYCCALRTIDDPTLEKCHNCRDTLNRATGFTRACASPARSS